MVPQIGSRSAWSLCLHTEWAAYLTGPFIETDRWTAMQRCNEMPWQTVFMPQP